MLSDTCIRIWKYHQPTLKPQVVTNQGRCLWTKDGLLNWSVYFKGRTKFAQTRFQVTCSYFDCIWKFRVRVKRRAWRKFLWVQQVGLKAILDTVGLIGVRICVEISFLWDWERRLIVCPVSGIHMFWHSNYSWDLVLQSSIFSVTALFLLRLSRRLKTSSVWRRENWKAVREKIHLRFLLFQRCRSLWPLELLPPPPPAGCFIKRI